MRGMKGAAVASLAVILTLWSAPVWAAMEPPSIPGDQMSLWWSIPFAGLLLSIATGPLLYPHFWEHHYGKMAFGWAALAIVPMVFAFGTHLSWEAVAETIAHEYFPFIVLLFALFTIAGGIHVSGNIHGTPAMNAGLLLIGAVLASFVGTTGASMIMIRPMIRANDNRPFNAHVVVFFIFLVSNIGGSLTPLGDPPLFVGFLRGVDFFWTTTHLWRETLLVGLIVLAVFIVMDTILHLREEGLPKIKDPTPDSRVRLKGWVNIPLLAGVIGAILLSANWKPGIAFHIAGVELQLQNGVRDGLLILLAVASVVLTRREHRLANGFTWGPILEVAKLFAGIFVCIIPVIAILRAGAEGALAPLFHLVTTPEGEPVNIAYFWMTGALSSFLDNAPTYLVFFELAGGDAQHLMTTMATTLVAISAGAVFMGANTYIGNAPNFMVYAIARERGINMPTFFGYMLWSGLILVPTFVVASLILLE